MDFIREHFTVLVLLVLILFSSLVTLHLMHHGQDIKFIEWGEGIAGGFVSALLLALKVGNSNGGKQ